MIAYPRVPGKVYYTTQTRTVMPPTPSLLTGIERTALWIWPLEPRITHMSEMLPHRSTRHQHRCLPQLLIPLDMLFQYLDRRVYQCQSQIDEGRRAILFVWQDQLAIRPFVGVWCRKWS